MERVGMKFISKKYGPFEVIEYKNHREVSIIFINTGTKVNNLFWGNVERCNVKDPMHPTVYGVGYLGCGNFSSKSHYLGASVYSAWKSMLQRCYSDKTIAKYKTYSQCYVDKEWHNFQVFAEWFVANYYKGGYLDKDLLKIGNNIYSEDTCIFISSEVNNLLTNVRTNKGILDTTGVTVVKSSNSFIASISCGTGVTKHLGSFKTLKEAEFIYISARAERILDVASMQANTEVKRALLLRCLDEIKSTVTKYLL